MNDQARTRLVELIKKHGVGIISEDRCIGLLLDYCGEDRREYSALLGALRERVPASLLTPSAVPRDVLMVNLTRRLEGDLGLSEEAASWAVKAWAEALGAKTDDAPAAPAPDKGHSRKAVAIGTAEQPKEKERGFYTRWIYVALAVLAAAFYSWFIFHRSAMNVRFFESSTDVTLQAIKIPAIRNYKTHFRRDQVQFVNFNLGLMEAAEGTQNLRAIWRGPNNQQSITETVIPSGSYTAEAGIGSDTLGTLRDGRYEVEFFLGDRKLGAAGFTIDPPLPLEVNSAFSYPSGSAPNDRQGPNTNHFFKPTLEYVGFDVTFSREAMDATPIQIICHLPDRTTQSNTYTLEVGSSSLKVSGCGYSTAQPWTLGKGTVEISAEGRKLRSIDFFVEPGTYVADLNAHVGPLAFYQTVDIFSRVWEPTDSFLENATFRCMVAELPVAYAASPGNAVGRVSLLSVWYRSSSAITLGSAQGEIHREMFSLEYHSSYAGQVHTEQVRYCPATGGWPAGYYKVVLSNGQKTMASGDFRILPWK